MLADAGAAGCSIEDFDPATDAIDPLEVAAERVAIAAEARRSSSPPAPRTTSTASTTSTTRSRACVAYRDAGADVVYAPGLADLGAITRVVEEVGIPVNVLALPNGPTVSELGLRRAFAASRPAARWRRRPTARCSPAPRSCATRERPATARAAPPPRHSEERSERGYTSAP